MGWGGWGWLPVTVSQVGRPLAFLRLTMPVPSGSDIDCDCHCSCGSVVVLSSDCFPCLFFLIFFCPTATCLENGQIIAPPPPPIVMQA